MTVAYRYGVKYNLFGGHFYLPSDPPANTTYYIRMTMLYLAES